MVTPVLITQIYICVYHLCWYNLVVLTSRQQVLETIRTHQPVTAQDLSRILKMTPANARHHLSILLEQGLIETAGTRAPAGRGRPSRAYRLSVALAGDNLGLLLDELLLHLGEGLDRDEQLHRLALGMASRTACETESTEHRRLAPVARLIQAVNCLNTLNYAARWEARAASPRLLFSRCPYQAVISSHPELCQMDIYLVEALTQMTTTQTAKLEPDPRGGTICVFQTSLTPPK